MAEYRATPESEGAEPNPSLAGEEGRDQRGWLPDSEVLSVVQREIDSSVGWSGTRLSQARRQRLNEYFGNPRGDEREGRSQVVGRDTFEQVEWLLAPMMEIFTGGPEVARFIAQGPEDEDAAKQATDAVNWVFEQNDGFMCLYTMFKDAFIQKLGVVKVSWDTSDSGTLEEYEGKTLQEVMALSMDPTFQAREANAWVEGEDGERRQVEPDEIGEEQIDPETLFFDVRGVRVNEDGRVLLENITPEEFLINRDARGLNHPTCRFVGHRMRVSQSQLIEWGFDPNVVRNLPPAGNVFASDTDAIVRNSQTDSSPFTTNYGRGAERIVYITESWVKLDRDGDGISEWWRVCVGGDYGQTLLGAVPSDGHPFAAYTPIPIPHTVYGLAIADVTADIQNLNTTLWRAYLDSLYLATDPRVIIRSRGIGESAQPLVNIDQLLDAAPGSYIEEYEANAIRPMQTVTNAEHMVPAMEFHKGLKQERTGISPEAMGLNPDAISKHVFGAMMQSSAQAQRIGIYARIAAETGVREMFKLIYKTILQHQTKPLMLRLRGEWVEVDPSSWKNDFDVRISVGLGHGSRMEKSTHLQTIAEVQKQILEGGIDSLVSVENIYNTAVDLAENLGFKDGSKYFTNPETVEPQPPEPDPAQLAIQIQQEIERQKLEIDRDKVILDAKKAELEHEWRILKLRAEYDLSPNRVPMDDPTFGLGTGPPGVQGGPNGAQPPVPPIPMPAPPPSPPMPMPMPPEDELL